MKVPRNMGNSSIEFPEIGCDKVKGNSRKDGKIDSNENKLKSYVTNESVKNYQNLNSSGICNKHINELPPKPPCTKKMPLGNITTNAEAKNKLNLGKEEKQKSRGFFRRNRSNSLEVSKSSHNSTNQAKNGIRTSNNNIDRNINNKGIVYVIEI